MCAFQVGRFLSISILALSLTACGENVSSAPSNPVTPTPTKTPPATLTGNWSLAGSRVTSANPTISALLYIHGNTVIGEAAFSARCTSSGLLFPVTVGGVLRISGTIADDGTFQAGSGPIGPPTQGTTSLSLAGNSPLPATPSMWTGTYSLVFTPASAGNACGISQAASFSATPIASVTGTYLGVPANTISPFGNNSVVSVQMAQGSPTLTTQGNTSRVSIPLTATLNVAGSSCPFSGGTSGIPEPSSMSGDSFDLILTQGFPFGFLSGTLNDPTANTFSGDLTSLAEVNGCPGFALYNFTRQ